MLGNILGRKYISNHSYGINGLCFNTNNQTKITKTDLLGCNSI